MLCSVSVELPVDFMGSEYDLLRICWLKKNNNLNPFIGVLWLRTTIKFKLLPEFCVVRKEPVCKMQHYGCHLTSVTYFGSEVVCQPQSHGVTQRSMGSVTSGGDADCCRLYLLSKRLPGALNS